LYLVFSMFRGFFGARLRWVIRLRLSGPRIG
jgi:hypothetical protein